jgi:uncharacterized protein YcgL (UPF0745 family)
VDEGLAENPRRLVGEKGQVELVMVVEEAEKKQVHDHETELVNEEQGFREPTT